MNDEQKQPRTFQENMAFISGYLKCFGDMLKTLPPEVVKEMFKEVKG